MVLVAAQQTSTLLESLGQLGSFLAGVAGAVAVVAIIVAYRQHQVQVRDSELHALFYVHGYLTQQRFAEARMHVRTVLVNRAYSAWDKYDRDMADAVAQSYDQAGILLELGVISDISRRRFLESSWGQSICDQFAILSTGWLDEKRTPTLTAREFFKHFVSLHDDALAYRE